MKRAYEDGLDESTLVNIDGTIFIVDMDNWIGFGLLEYNNMTYVEVINGGQGFTLVVIISGCPTANIEPVFFVFQSKDIRYTIFGTSDDVEKVSYRTGPNGCMEIRVFQSGWLSLEKYQLYLMEKEGFCSWIMLILPIKQNSIRNWYRFELIYENHLRTVRIYASL